MEGLSDAFTAERGKTFSHFVYRLKHIAGRNADDVNSALRNFGIAVDVSLGLITHIVGRAINLNRKSCGRAVEVDHKRAYRVLSAKFDFRLSEFTLQQDFRQ